MRRKRMSNMDVLAEIAKKAEALLGIDRIIVMMDLHFCMEKQPLDLKKLMDFEPADFAHDIFGINKHLNHETFELEDCFLPRSAV